jgi:ABC-type nitrate/sulfonate/bicarbonate transport system substrate-binding protein
MPSLGAAQSLRVYLDWFTNVEFAGMIVAMEKGWYQDEGIDLKMIHKDLDIIPRVLKGEADIGMHSGQDLIKYVSKGEKVKAIAALYQLNPNCIIVPQNSKIRSVKDLKGKTLAVFAPQDYGIYSIFLKNSGLSLEQVKFKDVTTFKESEIIKLFKSKVIDASIAWEFNWTLTFSLLKFPVRVFPSYENGFNFYGSVYFAPNEYINKHPDLIKKFVSVTMRGWREVYKKPEYWAKFVVEKYYPSEKYINGSKSLTLKQQTLELKLRKRYFFEGVGANSLGEMSSYQWERSVNIARKSSLISENSKITGSDVYSDVAFRRTGNK